MRNPIQIDSSNPVAAPNIDQNTPTLDISDLSSSDVISSDMTPEDMAKVTSEEATLAKATVSQYFDALNAEDFQATANLFAEEGTLYPPFESAIVGREAIVQYLETEAKGLQLSPIEYTTERLDDGNVQYKVTGKVQTPLFGVNVGWTFVLDSAAKILSAQVKLLAALEELLKGVVN